MKKVRYVDKALLSAGSIIYCDLLRGLFKHSGVYVGDGKVVELVPGGVIRLVSIDDFSKIGRCRTGGYIFVACFGGTPISSDVFANRAYGYLGNKNGYNIFNENCHIFTANCITGIADNKAYCLSVLGKYIKNIMNYKSDIDWLIHHNGSQIII